MKEKRVLFLPSLPQDSPLLSFADVAAYLRTTIASVRKMIDGRPDGEDEVGKILRQWVIILSPHRRYIMAEPFFLWLKTTAKPKPNGQGA